MRALAVTVVLAGSIAARPAGAQPGPSEPATTTVTKSYRRTVAVVDGIGLALLVPGVIGIFEAEGGLRAAAIVSTSVGGLVYLAGAPNVHRLERGNKEQAYISIFVRIFAPALLAVGGSKLYCGSESTGCDGSAPAALAGGAAGVGLAIGVDVFFARHRVVVPHVTPGQGGVTVGIATRF